MERGGGVGCVINFIVQHCGFFAEKINLDFFSANVNCSRDHPRGGGARGGGGD